MGLAGEPLVPNEFPMLGQEESSEEEYSYSEETNDEESPYRVHVTLPCEDTPDYTGTSDTSSARNCPYCA